MMRLTRLGGYALAAAAVVLAGVVVPATLGAAQSLTVTRYAGTDRFDTAAQVADATFTAPVPVAFIARGDAFADALAGTPAAAVGGGPVLLVESGAIPPATAAELTALTPGRIVVLGGPSAVADSVLTALKAYTTGSVTRLAGADRYATAAAISAATFSPGVGAAYIATDIGFADALAGGAAAGTAKDPILIVQQGAIPAATAQELTRLQPKSIVILGGLAAVSAAVATQLATFTTGAVTRVAGADRYATAVAISQASFPGTAASVYLATGANFPDALAGGVAAALAPGPLLLTLAACLPPNVAAEIIRLGATQVFILGGTSVISAAVDSLTVCALPQAITITPSTGLTDGQVVHVVATGFSPGVQYTALECADNGGVPAAGDCDVNGVKLATADAQGTVTLDYTARKGPFGTNNIVCGPMQKCAIGVAGFAPDNTAQAALEDITFA